ncbi:MAG TPA: hypothetical protein GXX17_03160 [Clostridiales bacterium]|nr:hypothetical protein [Clostridiales bacterium]
MKKIFFLILFAIILTLNVQAQAMDVNEIYWQQYALSGAGELYDNLTPEAKGAMDRLGLDPKEPSSISNFNLDNVFLLIRDFFKSGGTVPIKAGVSVFAVLLLAALVEGVGSGVERKGFDGIYTYVCMASIAAIVFLPLFQTILSTVNAIKGTGVFMLSFVPVYGGIILASGRVSTGMGFQTLLLAAAQVVVQAASFVITPLIGMYLAVNLSSSVSPMVKTAKLSEGLKKASSFLLTLLLTTFVGILGIQTAISAAGDNITQKTSKVLLGTFVPVVGPVLAESVGTVQSCVGLLKSSVGIYGVIALCFMLLPILIELIFWRLTVIISSAAADMMSLPRFSEFLKAVDAVVALLLGIVLMIAVLFIISLTVVSLAGGSA